MVAFAHSQGVPVLVDGAQSIPHMKVDVQDLDVDFYVFSGHKVYGSYGIGVLLERKPGWINCPLIWRREMIKNVSFEKTTFNQLPFKSQAGHSRLYWVYSTGKGIGLCFSHRNG